MSPVILIKERPPPQGSGSRLDWDVPLSLATEERDSGAKSSDLQEISFKLEFNTHPRLRINFVVLRDAYETQRQVKVKSIKRRSEAKV